MKRLFVLFGIIIGAFTAVSAFAECTETQMEYENECVDMPFWLTTSATDSFSFRIYAAGNFYIDCGNDGILSESGDAGTVSGNKITKPATGVVVYTCTWVDASATRKVRLGGRSTKNSNPAIRFILSDKFNNDVNYPNISKMTGIYGSLGAIFGTIVDANGKVTSQPGFKETFFAARNITSSIPPNLFEGVFGTPTSHMFNATFHQCEKMTGSIPETLFCSDPNNPNATNCIYGKPGERMFQQTFYRCKKLTGTNISNENDPTTKYAIPPKLFIGIRGQAAGSSLFNRFLYSCHSLTGTLHVDTFSGISGPAQSAMFEGAFSGTIITGFTDGVTTTKYAPATFANNLATSSSTGVFDWAFPNNTGLLTTCPEGMTNVTRSQFGGAHVVWCAPTCPAGSYNAKNTDACYPHILHIGDYNVYLKPVTENTPSPALRVKVGDDVFYANMKTAQTYMNNNTAHYLKIKYNNTTYYVCDDTICGE